LGNSTPTRAAKLGWDGNTAGHLACRQRGQLTPSKDRRPRGCAWLSLATATTTNVIRGAEAGKEIGRPTGRCWKQTAPRTIVPDERKRLRGVEEDAVSQPLAIRQQSASGQDKTSALKAAVWKTGQPRRRMLRISNPLEQSAPGKRRKEVDRGMRQRLWRGVDRTSLPARKTKNRPTSRDQKSQYALLKTR
jgi:hypothetical protein